MLIGMLTSDVISHFGSPVKTAQALGIGRPAITKWMKSGMVPPLSAARIEVLTNGKLKFKVSEYDNWYSRNRRPLKRKAKT
jgi:hypothetical protein